MYWSSFIVHFLPVFGLGFKWPFILLRPVLMLRLFPTCPSRLALVVSSWSSGVPRFLLFPPPSLALWPLFLFTCLNHCNLLCLALLSISFKLHLLLLPHRTLCPVISLQPYTSAFFNYFFKIYSNLPAIAHVSALYNIAYLIHISHTLLLLFRETLSFSNKLASSIFSICYTTCFV